MALVLLAVLAGGTSAFAQQARTGGSEYGAPKSAPAAVEKVVPGAQGRIVNGLAQAPAEAPPAIRKAIAAANTIVGKPYRYGGGHSKGFKDTGYDCSGAISVALNGAGTLESPLNSSGFLRWGKAGKGQWITVYTNPGHAFVVIAGLRLDTSAVNDPGGRKGPRWRPASRSTRGFVARHPQGL